jgi:hypothetical protein
MTRIFTDHLQQEMFYCLPEKVFRRAIRFYFIPQRYKKIIPERAEKKLSRPFGAGFGTTEATAVATTAAAFSFIHNS